MGFGDDQYDPVGESEHLDPTIHPPMVVEMMPARVAVACEMLRLYPFRVNNNPYDKATDELVAAARGVILDYLKSK